MTQPRTQPYTLSTGAVVTVREGIGMDAFDKLAIYPQLTYPRTSKRMVKRAEYFADALLRSTVEGELGFAWASPDDDAKALQAAFEGWQTLSNNDAVGWANALDSVNKVLIDPKAPASTSNEASSQPLTNTSPESTTQTSESQSSGSS